MIGFPPRPIRIPGIVDLARAILAVVAYCTDQSRAQQVTVMLYLVPKPHTLSVASAAFLAETKRRQDFKEHLVGRGQFSVA